MAVFTGGDDLGAVVLDVGSSTVKAGLAGAEAPSLLMPTLYTRVQLVGVLAQPPSPPITHTHTHTVAEVTSGAPRVYGRGRVHTFELTHTYTHGMTLRSPLVDGLVEDWDLLESILAHVCVSVCDRTHAHPHTPSASASSASGSRASSHLEVDLSSNPLILCEPAFASKSDRERWCEVLFEGFRCPGAFMSRGGVTAMYAHARTTGITVDMGGGGTTITPVQEGYPLMMGVKVNPIGGRVLTEQLLRALQQRGIAVKPRAGSAMASVQQYLVHGIAQDMKESVCKVSPTPVTPESGAASAQQTYELPDGTPVAVGPELLGIPELAFDPSPLGSSVPGAVPLHQTMLASAMACEPDIRRELVANLVLAGAASNLPGMDERILNEFSAVSPPGHRPRMVSAYPSERAFAAWMGGSILGCLGSFHDMWFSAEEYAEYGAKMIHRKCP